MGLEASSGAETPASVGVAPANYQGKSCLALAVEREKSQSLAVYVGEHQNYVRKQAQWAITSIEQVERETGCLPGATSTQVAAMDVVIREPSAAKELQSRMPPGAEEYIKGGGRVSPGSTFAAANMTAPAHVAGVPSAEPLQGASSISAHVPQQTSKAQWIANETTVKYQGRSCEYLQLAMEMSVRAEASDDADVRSFALAQKKSVSEVLATRSCPSPFPFLAGRLGAKVSSIDPIKAARLSMPLAGASIEQVIAGSPASRAGLMFADVVVAVGEIKVGDDIDFLVALNKIPTGSTAVLKISRNGALGLFPVVLGPPTNAQAISPGPSVMPVKSSLKEFCYIYMTSSAYEKNPGVLSSVFQDAKANSSTGNQAATIKAFQQKVVLSQPGIWRDSKVNDALCSASSGHCLATADGMFGPKQTTTLRCFDSYDSAKAALASDGAADPTAKIIPH